MKGITNTADEDERPELSLSVGSTFSPKILSPKERKNKVVEKPADRALDKIKSNNALVKH